MAITITLTHSELADKIFNDRNSCWSWLGARGLAAYLIDLSEDIGDFDLDLVALNCEFSEYTWRTLADSYIFFFTKSDYETLLDGSLEERLEILDEYYIDVIWNDAGTIVIRDF